MALETVVNSIADLNTAWPTPTDLVKNGDDHIRIIKEAVKKTFPNINAPIAASDEDFRLFANAMTFTDANVAVNKPLDLKGNKISNVGAPAAAGDASTKGYVDTQDDAIRAAVNEAIKNSQRGKNLLINGDFRIWQRGETFTVAPNAYPYTADRWYVWCGNAPIQVELNKAWAGPQSPNVIFFTGNAGNGGVSLEHLVESVNTTFAQGGTNSVTVSFYVNPSINRSLAIQCFYLNSKDNLAGGATVFGSNNVQINAGGWVKVTSTFAVPTQAINGIRLAIGFGGALEAGQTVAISSAQMEIGTVATDFEYTDYSTELAKCQRYYIPPKNFACTVEVGGLYIVGSQQYMAKMRKQPTTVWKIFNPASGATIKDNATSVVCNSNDELYVNMNSEGGLAQKPTVGTWVVLTNTTGFDAEIR